ncbi:MAG: 30S ribosome-binding factor RbfA [Candidatus Firestonebacteria bacterium]
MSLRIEKLSKQFQREASDIISRELNDPDIGFVTVTNVKISDNIRKVTIFVRVLGNENVVKKTIKGLKRASGFVRRQLAKRIVVRFMPEIDFELDLITEEIEKTLNLFRTIEK